MHILLFFDVSGGEILVIVLFALIFFGSKNIPELMRGLGRGIREFKNATNAIQREIREGAEQVQQELKKPIDSQISKPLDQQIESFEKEVQKIESDINKDTNIN
ncbi:MAG: twin-arginine translocase TatA/TatE family subunit [Flavobacteriales bacterium]|nr:twin-arginine translocase TatA/TatE family subunit [Flavobacteriales bacterium]